MTENLAIRNRGKRKKGFRRLLLIFLGKEKKAGSAEDEGRVVPNRA